MMYLSKSALLLCALHSSSAFLFRKLEPKRGLVVTHSTFEPDSRASGAEPLAGEQFVNTKTSAKSPSMGTAPGGAISFKKPSSARTTPSSDSSDDKTIWDSEAPVTVQGGNTLRTWSFASPFVERVQVLLKTDGRPLNANIDLWEGPDNTPQKIRVYVDDGFQRPFSAVIETPGEHNAVALRNTGPIEFPLTACVEADIASVQETANGPMPGVGGLDVGSMLPEGSVPRIMQGGSVYTVPFDPLVSSVQILLKTDGRPLNARIELLQGPNNSKQVMEVYTEDGALRPFYVVVETPGAGNVVRLINTATVEFPITASVEPYLIESDPTQNNQGTAFIMDHPW